VPLFSNSLRYSVLGRMEFNHSWKEDNCSDSTKWQVRQNVVTDVPASSVWIRVARWYIFEPKTPIWVNFGVSCKDRCRLILWPLVCCTKKNLATLVWILSRTYFNCMMVKMLRISYIYNILYIVYVRSGVVVIGTEDRGFECRQGVRLMGL
jgi:hypothetical protein